MKDEVKEILARLKNNDFERDYNDGSYYKELYLSEIDTLLDYITNLQEENERLQKNLDFMTDRNNEKQEVINKAIEYCNLYTRLSAKELSNILEGDKDD